MLRALYELAQREGLLEDPDYEEARVDFYAVIDESGKLLSLIPTAGEDDKPAKIKVPRMPKRVGQAAPGFFFDNSKFVFGIGGWDKKAGKVKDDPERVAKYLQAFAAQVAMVADETGDEAVHACARFCQNLATNRGIALGLRPQEQWSGGENIAFRVGTVDEPLHLRPSVRAAWARRRTAPQEGGSGSATSRCLITGAPTIPHRLHGEVKRVQGALTKGAPLVSFDKDAFGSHGLSRGENAPVSRQAAEGYVTALNYLLSEQPTPRRTHRGGVRVGIDSVLFWTRDKADEWQDLLALLEGPNKDEPGRILESPWRGLDPGPVDSSPFYAVTLSGNAGRIVVRDWFESRLGDAKAALRRYFDALALGNQSKEALPLWRLLSALQPPGNSDVHPGLAARVARVALYGGALPPEAMRHALQRLRVPPRDGAADPQLWPRCALVKAVLITYYQKEVAVSLDANNQEVPYLLGRLFAVIERLQGTAQGDINATIRDRYFGAASSTPAVVFPRLLRLSVHHASKAEKLGGWLEGIKGKIVNQLPPAAFPSVMGLEAQGLFAVGYYHQREAFFQKRSSTPETEEE